MYNMTVKTLFASSKLRAIPSLRRADTPIEPIALPSVLYFMNEGSTTSLPSEELAEEVSKKLSLTMSPSFAALPGR